MNLKTPMLAAVALVMSMSGNLFAQGHGPDPVGNGV